MLRREALLLTALPLLGACSRAAREPVTPTDHAAGSASEPWLTSLDRAHPLVGKLCDAASGALATPELVAKRVAAARYVLVGERHDNPDHHRLQARALSWMVTAGRKPAVAFEMLEVEQQALVDAHGPGSGVQASQLGAALGWEKTSWPPYREYQPIFEVALQAGLRIAAANLSQADAKALVKQGLSALPAERVQQLRLDGAFPDSLQQALLAELKDSHCGQLPESLLAPMALAQHARDAQMAAVLAQAGAEGALLIAGAGHVRKDRGVPYYLALQAPGASVLSVAVQEVYGSRREPQDYLERHPHSAPPFDYLWFTPRLSDDDPCAAFKTK